jgi:Cu/Ag efflux protein CusF
MKAKILSTVSIGLMVVSPMVWGMDMGEHHSHPSNTVMSEQTIHASGTIKAIADNHESVHIFHNPIPELGWSSMNMPFNVIDHELIHPLNVGDKVDFDFIQKEGKNVIVRMKKQ